MVPISSWSLGRILGAVNTAVPNRTDFGTLGRHIRLVWSHHAWIMARLLLAKIRTISRVNSPDTAPERTKTAIRYIIVRVITSHSVSYFT